MPATQNERAQGTAGHMARPKRAGRPAVANSTADRAIDILLSFTDDRPS